LRAAVDETTGVVTFIEQLRCPVLLLSYEKSAVFPGEFIDAIIRFCGLPRNNRLRERLLGLIEPNRPAYIAGVRRSYDGLIEGMTDGCLYGWCRLAGSVDPVALELFVDDKPVQAFVADAFRQDLLEARVGKGHHGFFLDLRRLGLHSASVIRVKVASHGVELANGGKRVSDYLDGRPGPAAEPIRAP
jgi:hypothetical protein